MEEILLPYAPAILVVVAVILRLTLYAKKRTNDFSFREAPPNTPLPLGPTGEKTPGREILERFWEEDRQVVSRYEFRFGRPQVSLLNEARVERLKGLFEGREAIYVEKGALRVKVTNIRGDVARQYVSAEVEEIPTTGLPVGLFDDVKKNEPSPLRWHIEAGYLTTFSDHSWHMGYGGWCLFFAPRTVEGVQSLAAWFPDNLDPHQRYKEVCDYLTKNKAYEPTQRLFAERHAQP